MTPEGFPHDREIDWEQVAELAGPPGSAPVETEIGAMWREMSEDLDRDLASLAALAQAGDGEGLRQGLHRVYGYVSSWGLAGVAAQLRASEWSEDPVAHFEREAAAVRARAQRAREQVLARYPGLGDGGEAGAG